MKPGAVQPRFGTFGVGGVVKISSRGRIIAAFGGGEVESRAKSYVRRVVSMLTRLIQRTQTAFEDSIEYEYREAEYQYDDS